VELLLLYQTEGFIVLDGKREENYDVSLMTSAEAQMHEKSVFDVEMYIGKLEDVNHQIFIIFQENNLEHRGRKFRSEF